MENLTDIAMEMALRAHHGHTNKHDGEPYVLHLMRVSHACRDAGLDDIHQAVAWLHDSVEDGKLTLFDIVAAFPLHPEISTNVAAISKDGTMSNEEYYHRLLSFPVAARVKLRDLYDNFRRNHSITDPETKLRMAKKYSLGMDTLGHFL